MASSNIKYPLLILIGIMAYRIIENIRNIAEEVIIPRITCPALMFADSRNDRVMGRMYDLKVSTIERNLAIIFGVFSGSRWAVIILILIVIEININVNHDGSPILRVVRRWEVIVII